MTSPDTNFPANPSTLPMFIFVGGFLGAGKTTLILNAARLLTDCGQRVAAIMNDQDSELVDTRQSQANNILTREVAGGCFCCRFSDLLGAAGELTAYQPDVIFAEPVGSCVDLSATIFQPLRSFYNNAYRLAPLTVLVDPGMLKRSAEGEIDQDIEFLFRNQIAEADLICLTKRDLYPATSSAYLPADYYISAKSGEGVDDWLTEVLAFSRIVGARILDVDYGRYAKAEAALGWLNLHADLHLSVPTSVASVVGPVLDFVDEHLTREGVRLAHLKMFDQTAGGWIRGSITSNGEHPVIEGDLLAEPAREHQLAINLRALAEPAMMEALVKDALKSLGGEVRIRHSGAFRPPPPVPEHRFTKRAQ